MDRLTPEECRVLGVLIEKAHTTPAQYPLTLNALVTGSNQRSNRDPVTSLDEDDVLEALDRLRALGFVREVMLTGSRVQKFKHAMREALELSTSELAVLAELLLRGPQTVGELRGRASRIHALESIEVVTNVLDHLAARQPPLTRSLPPAPGSRAGRYAQLFCPDLHPLDAPAPSGATVPASSGGATAAAEPGLAARIECLEREVAALREMVEQLGAANRGSLSAP